jgi:hypothetical protein
VLKVRWNVPALCFGEPGALSAKVTVCMVSPMAQVQVTVAPVATLTLAGEKKLFPTVTALLPPPVLGPLVVSEPPPPQAAKLMIVRARTTILRRIVTSVHRHIMKHPNVYE